MQEYYVRGPGIFYGLLASALWIPPPNHILSLQGNILATTCLERELRVADQTAWSLGRPADCRQQSNNDLPESIGQVSASFCIRPTGMEKKFTYHIPVSSVPPPLTGCPKQHVIPRHPYDLLTPFWLGKMGIL